MGFACCRACSGATCTCGRSFCVAERTFPAQRPWRRRATPSITRSCLRISRSSFRGWPGMGCCFMACPDPARLRLIPWQDALSSRTRWNRCVGFLTRAGMQVAGAATDQAASLEHKAPRPALQAPLPGRCLRPEARQRRPDRIVSATMKEECARQRDDYAACTAIGCVTLEHLQARTTHLSGKRI
jgi:hypothetical protein